MAEAVAARVPVVDYMHTHPNCRCVMVPVAKSWTELGYPEIDAAIASGELDGPAKTQSGEDVLRGMSVRQQQRTLGRGRWGAWRGSTVPGAPEGVGLPLSRFYVDRYNEEWGWMLQLRNFESTMTELAQETSPEVAEAVRTWRYPPKQLVRQYRSEMPLPALPPAVAETVREETEIAMGRWQTKIATEIADDIGEEVATDDARVDAKIVQLNAAVRAALDPVRTEVRIRVPEVVLGRIIDDGRLKSQFEVGRSRGMFDPDTRANTERIRFGYEAVWPDGNPLNRIEFPVEQRPIYGYIGDVWEDGATDHYGNVVIRLRDTVDARTTVTGVDSLIFGTRTEYSQAAAVPYVEPTIAMMSTLRGAADVLDSRNLEDLGLGEYIEAQVHGQVTLDDIAEVVFTQGPNTANFGTTARIVREGLRRRLAEAGIPSREVLTWDEDREAGKPIDPRPAVVKAAVRPPIVSRETRTPVRPRTAKLVPTYKPDVMLGPLEWVDPGEKPNERMPEDIASWPNEQAIEWFDAKRKLVQAWTNAIQTGLSMGLITKEDAVERGWDYPSGRIDSIGPLPATLYHATTAVSAIMATGLKTRDELSGVTALGGGPTDTISFTTDRAIAVRIAEVFIEAHDVLTGALTFETLVERAEAGGFLNEWIGSVVGGRDLPVGPEGDARRATFYRLFRDRLKYERASFPLPANELPAGSIPDADAASVGGDGVVRYYAWDRPMTEDEYLEDLFDAWRGPYNTWQEVKGGPMDPLFFSPDIEALKRMDVSQVGVVEGTPVPGAVGVQVSSLGEWRTWAGAAVTVQQMVMQGPAVAVEEAVRSEEEQPEAGPPADYVPAPIGLRLDRPKDPQRARVFDTALVAREAIAKALGINPSESRWSGDVIIESNSYPRGGYFNWEGSLAIRDATEQSIARRIGLVVHEMLHAASAGSHPAAYRVWPGWEEGVAEGLTQILVGEVATTMGYDAASVNETRGIEGYAEYTGPLETIRGLLGMTPEAFYVGLIRTPIMDRPKQVKDWAYDKLTTPNDWRRVWAAVRALDTANPIASEEYRAPERMGRRGRLRDLSDVVEELRLLVDMPAPSFYGPMLNLPGRDVANRLQEYLNAYQETRQALTPEEREATREQNNRLLRQLGGVGASGTVSVDGFGFGVAPADTRSLNEVARSAYQQAVVAEPGITADVVEIGAALGLDPDYEGRVLDNRLKSELSLRRKIGNDAAAEAVTFEQAAANLKDTVRYTYVVEVEGYAASYRATEAAFLARGYTLLRTKNFWHPEPRQYQGLNSVFISPTGMPVEVQFHTADSLRAKNLNHELKDEFELATTTEERREELLQQMLDNQAPIPDPPDVYGIGESVDRTPMLGPVESIIEGAIGSAAQSAFTVVIPDLNTARLETRLHAVEPSWNIRRNQRELDELVLVFGFPTTGQEGTVLRSDSGRFPVYVTYAIGTGEPLSAYQDGNLILGASVNQSVVTGMYQQVLAREGTAGLTPAEKVDAGPTLTLGGAGVVDFEIGRVTPAEVEAEAESDWGRAPDSVPWTDLVSNVMLDYPTDVSKAGTIERIAWVGGRAFDGTEGWVSYIRRDSLGVAAAIYAIDVVNGAPRFAELAFHPDYPNMLTPDTTRELRRHAWLDGFASPPAPAPERTLVRANATRRMRLRTSWNDSTRRENELAADLTGDLTNQLVAFSNGVGYFNADSRLVMFRRNGERVILVSPDVTNPDDAELLAIFNRTPFPTTPAPTGVPVSYISRERGRWESVWSAYGTAIRADAHWSDPGVWELDVEGQPIRYWVTTEGVAGVWELHIDGDGSVSLNPDFDMTGLDDAAITARFSIEPNTRPTVVAGLGRERAAVTIERVSSPDFTRRAIALGLPTHMSGRVGRAMQALTTSIGTQVLALFDGGALQAFRVDHGDRVHGDRVAIVTDDASPLTDAVLHSYLAAAPGVVVTPPDPLMVDDDVLWADLGARSTVRAGEDIIAETPDGLLVYYALGLATATKDTATGVIRYRSAIGPVAARAVWSDPNVDGSTGSAPAAPAPAAELPADWDEAVGSFILDRWDGTNITGTVTVTEWDRSNPVEDGPAGAIVRIPPPGGNVVMYASYDGLGKPDGFLFLPSDDDGELGIVVTRPGLDDITSGAIASELRTRARQAVFILSATWARANEAQRQTVGVRVFIPPPAPIQIIIPPLAPRPAMPTVAGMGYDAIQTDYDFDATMNTVAGGMEQDGQVNDISEVLDGPPNTFALHGPYSSPWSGETNGGVVYYGPHGGAVAVAHIGMAQGGQTTPDNPDGMRSTGVHYIKVHPSFRRLGIATRLYEWATLAGLQIEEESGLHGLTTDGGRYWSARRAKPFSRVSMAVSRMRPELGDATTFDDVIHLRKNKVIAEATDALPKELAADGVDLIEGAPAAYFLGRPGSAYGTASPSATLPSEIGKANIKRVIPASNPVIGRFENGAEPSQTIEIDPTEATLDDIDFAGAYAVRRNKQDAVITTLVGDVFERLGLPANGVSIRIEGIPLGRMAEVFADVGVIVPMATIHDATGMVEFSSYDAMLTDEVRAAFATLAQKYGATMNVLPAHIRWYWHDQETLDAAKEWFSGPQDASFLANAIKSRLVAAGDARRAKRIRARRRRSRVRPGEGDGAGGAPSGDGLAASDDARAQPLARRAFPAGAIRLDPDLTRPLRGESTFLLGEVRTQAAGVLAEVEAATGLVNVNWTGRVKWLVPGGKHDGAQAALGWDGTLYVDKNLLLSTDTEALRHVLVHEMLHAVSQTTAENFQRDPLMEEGMVEGLARDITGYTTTAYQTALTAWEQLRQAMDVPKRTFYAKVLAEPLETRREVLRDWAAARMGVPEGYRAVVLATFRSEGAGDAGQRTMLALDAFRILLGKPADSFWRDIAQSADPWRAMMALSADVRDAAERNGWPSWAGALGIAVGFVRDIAEVDGRPWPQLAMDIIAGRVTLAQAGASVHGAVPPDGAAPAVRAMRERRTKRALEKRMSRRMAVEAAEVVRATRRRGGGDWPPVVAP